jgi:dTDP-4-amino-4,6-dideoxygalactose transaminase
LVGVQPGDEVIVPTLTFIAPVNAVAYNGASPVFMDADDYYNIDTEKTIEFINKETVFKDGFTFNKKTNRKIAAIIPVHVFGNAALLDELIPFCEEHNIRVVEDATESMGTRYSNSRFSGKHTGMIGDLGCLSFNGNKIMTTGGGGMILINEERLAEKARYLTTQAKDDPVRYIHHELGYNFRLSNVQAAIGVAQLEQMPAFLKRKREIFHQYQTALYDVDGLYITDVPEYSINNHWMNVLQIDSDVYGENWEILMQRLEKNNIQTRPVWMLTHLQKPYKYCQNYRIERAKKLLNNSLCLPSSSNLIDDNFDQVINQLHG